MTIGQMEVVGSSDVLALQGQNSTEENTAQSEVPRAPYFYYKDYSHLPDPDPSKPVTAYGRIPNFPAKLFAILRRPDLADIISWMPHGRSWKVHKPREFEVKVIPAYFDHGKFSSFIRQANGWGFKRLSSKGPDRNSHYHELFLRGMPHLLKLMKRPGATTKHPEPPQLANEAPSKRPKKSSTDPDLYKISEEHPLPESKESPDSFPPQGAPPVSGAADFVGSSPAQPYQFQATTAASIMNQYRNHQQQQTMSAPLHRALPMPGNLPVQPAEVQSQMNWGANGGTVVESRTTVENGPTNSCEPSSMYPPPRLQPACLQGLQPQPNAQHSSKVAPSASVPGASGSFHQSSQCLWDAAITMPGTSIVEQSQQCSMNVGASAGMNSYSGSGSEHGSQLLTPQSSPFFGGLAVSSPSVSPITSAKIGEPLVHSVLQGDDLDPLHFFLQDVYPEPLAPSSSNPNVLDIKPSPYRCGDIPLSPSIHSHHKNNGVDANTAVGSAPTHAPLAAPAPIRLSPVYPASQQAPAQDNSLSGHNAPSGEYTVSSSYHYNNYEMFNNYSHNNNNSCHIDTQSANCHSTYMEDGLTTAVSDELLYF